MAFVKEFISNKDKNLLKKKLYDIESKWSIDRDRKIFLYPDLLNERPDTGGPTDRWYFCYHDRHILIELGYIQSPISHNEPYFTEWVMKIMQLEDKTEISLQEALAILKISKRAFAKMLEEGYESYNNYCSIDPSKQLHDHKYIFLFKEDNSP